MKLNRPSPLRLEAGSDTGTIRAGVELTVNEWDEITSGLRSDGMFDTISNEAELPLEQRILLLFELALAEWEQTNHRSGIDPMDDPDDPWPF